MIGKVPRPGKGFKGLVNYLLRGAKKLRHDPSRVAWIEMHNMLLNDPEKAPALMRATASKSRRVKTPVYHYVISWHERENPSEDLMRQVADVTCGDLGLEDYQRLYIAHHDTAHKHVHIVVNRVHPETGKAWRTNHDYARIEVSLRRQSEALGLEYVPGRHNDPEKFRGKSRRARDPDYQMAKREKKHEPLQQWDKDTVEAVKPYLQKMFNGARDWDEIDRGLARAGLALERKGQGVVISDGVGAMKLSQLGKQVRLASLEKRLGGPWKDQPIAVQPELNVERNEAFEKLSSAHAETDLAFALYEMGLASRQDLERSIQDRERIQGEADSHRSFSERLQRELAVRDPQPSREGRSKTGTPRHKKRRRRRDRGLER